MSGYVRQGSPLSPLLTGLAIPHPVQFGALIAFCEVLAGLSTLLGLLTRLGALGGAAISLTLFLTATWTVHPFFLGADLPYAISWLTLALAGPGLYSLNEYFFGEAIRTRLDRPEPARLRHRRRGGRWRGPGAGSVLLGNVMSLAANSAGQYTDPASGDPALLIHLPDGQFVAYDLKNSAAVLAGPTSQPLAALTVRIDPKGSAYAAGRPGTHMRAE